MKRAIWGCGRLRGTLSCLSKAEGTWPLPSGNVADKSRVPRRRNCHDLATMKADSAGSSSGRLGGSQRRRRRRFAGRSTSGKSRGGLWMVSRSRGWRNSGVARRQNGIAQSLAPHTLYGHVLFGRRVQRAQNKVAGKKFVSSVMRCSNPRTPWIRGHVTSMKIQFLHRKVFRNDRIGCSPGLSNNLIHKIHAWLRLMGIANGCRETYDSTAVVKLQRCKHLDAGDSCHSI